MLCIQLVVLGEIKFNYINIVTLLNIKTNGRLVMFFINKLKSQIGLALDETILVMTMLSGFTGFVVVADPLGISGNDNITEKLSTDLQKIEMANYEFYRRYLSWPQETTNGDWNNNILVLHSSASMKPYYKQQVYSSINFLPQYEKINSKTMALQHNIGEGGDISQHVIEYNGDKYLEVILKDVPYDIARDLDVKIDGEYNPNSGRVNIIFDNEKVNIYYRANKV